MQAQNYSIKAWAEEDRPREKLLSKNPNSLTDSELLAILIGKGSRDKNAVDLAKELLASVKNNLNELGRLEIHDLLKLNGIGKVKAVVILAALELGRQAAWHRCPGKTRGPGQSPGSRLPEGNAAGPGKGGFCRYISEPGQPGKPF